MSRLCLDTSAYSHFMRGDPPVVQAIDEAEWLGMPTVTLGELRIGFLLGGRRRENELLLRDFMDHPLLHELPVSAEVAEIYAELFVALRRGETPVPTNDVWIAACAVRAGATVLTYDPHFEAISRVGSRVLPFPSRE